MNGNKLYKDKNIKKEKEEKETLGMKILGKKKTESVLKRRMA